jgi:hypothetical protein
MSVVTQDRAQRPRIVARDATSLRAAAVELYGRELNARPSACSVCKNTGTQAFHERGRVYSPCGHNFTLPPYHLVQPDDEAE